MGLVLDAVVAKMEALKKGKSQVVEVGHVLLIGWGDMNVHIVKEIAMANESEGGGVVVILGEREKETMEIEFATQCKPSELMGTRVVFRSGSALLMPDLLKVRRDTRRDGAPPIASHSFELGRTVFARSCSRERRRRSGTTVSRASRGSMRHRVSSSSSTHS